MPATKTMRGDHGVPLPIVAAGIAEACLFERSGAVSPRGGNSSRVMKRPQGR